jgi:hypothetical protein
VWLRSNRNKVEDFALVYIGRSESHGHWTAGRIQSWKCLRSRLSFLFHSAEIATNELVNVVMYRKIICRVGNADIYTGDLAVRQQSNRTIGVFLLRLNRSARRLKRVTWRRSTQIDQCKRAFSSSVESKRSPITSKHGLNFQFWSYGESHAIDQCKRALSDAVPRW